MSYVDDLPFEDYAPTGKFVRCTRCGRGGLKWAQDDRGWFLVHVGGNVHKCNPDRVRRETAKFFEPVKP